MGLRGKDGNNFGGCEVGHSFWASWTEFRSVAWLLPIKQFMALQLLSDSDRRWYA